MWDSNIYWSSHRTTFGTEFITIVKKCQDSGKNLTIPASRFVIFHTFETTAPFERE
jgi:hypothetical protein